MMTRTQPAVRRTRPATTARRAPAPECHELDVRRELHADGVAVITFDRPGSGVNIFDRVALNELKLHLDWLARQRGLRGVILQSAKPAVFIAGADLKTLARADEAGLARLLELGQEIFNQLAALPVPTVAAIHGAAMGGGLEMALACDYRVASDSRTTRLALPETQLGILPAWGGCTRLPRLIGLPQALDLILTGRRLTARQSRSLGLIDAVVPREHLQDEARRCIDRGQPARPGFFHLNNRLVATFSRWRARKKLKARTRGHYPALLAVLEVVTRGVSQDPADTLVAERESALRLARTPASRNLIHLFFLREKARRGKSTAPPIARAAVVGAGVMGAGIAQWLAAHGRAVLLRDVDDARVTAGLARALQLFKNPRFSPLERRDGMDRITPIVHDVPLDNTDLVMEAAPERMDLKQELLSHLAAVSGPDTILATNTSALSVTGIARATHCPERVLGLHFFNPVHRMELVEVIRGRCTSEDTVARVAAFVRDIGKVPVVVRDSPGFLLNRILMPQIAEAVRLFEQGADIAKIDRAMRDYGMPMGPLRLLDEVGLDVALSVARILAGAFGERLAVPATLARMIDAGMLGRKTGRGFYVYRGELSVPNHVAGRWRVGDGMTGLSSSALQHRLELLLLNEAARCVEENVAATPGEVDLAMVLGAGFAPFRGGPLRRIDALGPRAVVEALIDLTGINPRFAPCALLQRMSAAGDLFYNRKEVADARR